MIYVLDLDGVARELPEQNGLSARVAVCQHVLRLCTPKRTHDLLQGSSLELDAALVVACLERVRSDMEFQVSVHEEYRSLARLHEIRDLSVSTDKAKLKDFFFFEYDRFLVGRSSIADFLPSSYRPDFSSTGCSPDTILAIKKALENFELVVLLYLGISCGDAIKETCAVLSDGPRIHGIEVSYVFFVINLAIADTMRTVRFEKEEVMGEFRGQDALGKLLSKALGRAVRDIPLPNCNTGAINYFLKNIYGRITWKRITGAVSITGTVSGDTVKEAVPRPKRVRSTFKDRREKKRLAGLVAGEKVTVPVTPGGGGQTPTQATRGYMTRGHHVKRRGTRRRS